MELLIDFADLGVEGMSEKEIRQKLCLMLKRSNLNMDETFEYSANGIIVPSNEEKEKRVAIEGDSEVMIFYLKKKVRGVIQVSDNMWKMCKTIKLYDGIHQLKDIPRNDYEFNSDYVYYTSFKLITNMTYTIKIVSKLTPPYSIVEFAYVIFAICQNQGIEFDNNVRIEQGEDYKYIDEDQSLNSLFNGYFKTLIPISESLNVETEERKIAFLNIYVKNSVGSTYLECENLVKKVTVKCSNEMDIVIYDVGTFVLYQIFKDRVENLDKDVLEYINSD